MLTAVGGCADIKRKLTRLAAAITIIWLSGAGLSVAAAGRALLQGLPRNCLDSGAHLSLGQIGIDAPMECTGRAYTAVTASALVVGTAILISAILFYGS
jgi:hypothetical protein